TLRPYATKCARLAHAANCPSRSGVARVVPYQTRPRSCYPNRILQARRNREQPGNDRSCAFETVVGDGEVFQPLTAEYVLSPIRRSGRRPVSIIRDLRPLDSPDGPELLHTPNHGGTPHNQRIPNR